MKAVIRTIFTTIAMTAVMGYSHDMNRHQTSPTNTAMEKKTEFVPQTTCPVMGGKIDKKQFVDYQGKRIYVCCPGCKGTVAKDPEKYIKKLESMGQSVEIIDSSKAMHMSMTPRKTPSAPSSSKALVPQKTCPVMGNPIDKSIFVDYQGKRVYFCCAMCPPKFEQDPEKYLKKLKEMGEAPEKIPRK